MFVRGFKRVFAVAGACVMIVGAGLLYGFTPVQEQSPVIFSIFLSNESSERIDVTDELLRGGWYNYESQKKFRDSTSLQKRAQSIKSKKYLHEIKNNFPDIFLLIENIRKRVEISPIDGNIIFEPELEDKFRVVGQRAGRDMDEAKLAKDIIVGLKTGQHFDVHASVKIVQPRSESEILKKVSLRGGYTTYFEKNCAREHNIALALGAFNGLVVQKGETVSFNRVVGPRTRERGYAEAKIILDGQFVPGVGGGVCQASTTLFNAALLSGLTIDKSYNHSLAIAYVPIGRDAMVSSAADLRFVNNTGGTVYIEAGVRPATDARSGSAYVRIYGNRTDIKYKPRTEVIEHELGDFEIDPARESRTYIEAWKGNQLVHSKLVRKSKYKSRTENCPLWVEF